MKKFKTILILVICSLLPLLFTTTIPYAVPTRLPLNSAKENEHSWTRQIKLYTITLEEGSQYTIEVNIDTFWGMDISLRIAETPYMINGLVVDSGSYTGEIMHFTALKTGKYYLQIKVYSGGGFYDIIVRSGIVGSTTGSNMEFFDVSYLLVLILPSIFIMAIGLLILRRRTSLPEKKPTINIYKRIEKEKKTDLTGKEDLMICEYCGSEVNKHLKRCPNCNAPLH